MLNKQNNTMVFKIYPGLTNQKLLIFHDNECINEINFSLTNSIKKIGERLVQCAIEQNVKTIEIHCNVAGFARPIYEASIQSNTTQYANHNIDITLVE